MSSPSLTPDEIRAAAETHHELGPDYQFAVIESFLDKVGKEIDARVDARLAGHQASRPGAAAQYPAQPYPGQYPAQPYPVQPGVPPAARHTRDSKQFALAVVSMVLGIPLSAIAVSAGPNPVGGGGLVIIWLAIAVINVAYALGARPPADRR